MLLTDGTRFLDGIGLEGGSAVGGAVGVEGGSGSKSGEQSESNPNGGKKYRVAHSLVMHFDRFVLTTRFVH